MGGMSQFGGVTPHTPPAACMHLRIGPIAPIDWVRRCVEFLISGNPSAAGRIMMGLNFYGHEQTSKTSSFQAITSKRYCTRLYVLYCMHVGALEILY